MSVLIQGMDMPECCEVCPCYNWVEDICRITDSPNDFSDTRVSDCPFAEVPTPHGRLIDADELEKSVHEWYDVGEYVFADTIRNADTIIEAEVNEE